MVTWVGRRKLKTLLWKLVGKKIYLIAQFVVAVLSFSFFLVLKASFDVGSHYLRNEQVGCVLKAAMNFETLLVLANNS